MVDISTIFTAAEWIGLVLVFVAAIIMVRIGKVTGWFAAWGILSASFFLIVIRRLIVAYAPYTGIQTQLGYLNQTLLLVLGIMYVIGFSKLYNLFKAEKR